MAHNGYLNLEGGDHLVEFIVRQCSVDETAVSNISSYSTFLARSCIKSYLDVIPNLRSLPEIKWNCSICDYSKRLHSFRVYTESLE